MNILHLDSCALGNDSVCRRFSAQAATALAGKGSARVVYRDLAATSLSHVSAPMLQVMRGQWDNTIPMSAELRAELLLAEMLLQEFMNADLVVLGAPMNNFGMSSLLKSWLDRVVQPGRTIEVADAAARAALKNKRIVIVSSICTSQDEAGLRILESHEQHLQAAFTSMGITEVKVIRTRDWDSSVLTINEWCEDHLEAA